MARANFKTIIYFASLLILFVAMWAVILYLPRTGQVVYNCTMAEISPDFPPKARDACRKLRLENFKNDTTR